MAAKTDGSERIPRDMVSAIMTAVVSLHFVDFVRI